jgi:hypothetical protein
LWWTALLAVCAVPTFASINEATPIFETETIRAEFGVFIPTESGELILKPSKIVPLKEGQQYGWSMLLRTKKPKLKWREEFTLPSVPTIWNGDLSDATQSISQDKKTSVIEKEVIPTNGTIESIWEVAPGDPSGHYIIKVTVDGDINQVFEFDIHGKKKGSSH